MRLHTLEVTAFGPFAETVRVDFDRLSEAGLFLLSGATGSGKSSVLDAVCFALYGDVPGDRGDARRLRCDQAAPDVAPRVVLEATLGGRRFRLDRSPAWVRPKRRGTGTTQDQARVALLQHVGEEWLVRSTRLDETGHLVTDLLGLTMGQFCQVAMLPQGQFQAFLRARSETRQALLQRVFRTSRFERVEKWLRDHRLQLRRDAAAHAQAVTEIVSRLSETTDTPPPTDWVEEHDAPSIVRSWASRLVEATAGAERASAEVLTTAQTRARAAESAHVEAVDLRRRVLRLQEAQAQRELLQQVEAEHAERQQRSTAARRAAPLAAILDHADAASEAAAAARAVHDQVRARWIAALPPGSGHADDPDAWRDTVLTRRAEVARLVAREAQAATHETELEGLAKEVEDLELRRTDLRTVIDALPQRVERARTDLVAASAQGQRLASLREQEVAVARRLEAATRARSLEQRLAAAQRMLSESTTALQQVKEHWLDLREQRLEGMAGEIASALVSGESCPVCGSCEHPTPARGAKDAPDAAAEKAARASLDDMEVRHHAHDEQVRTLTVELAGAAAAAGDGADLLPEQRVEIGRQIASAQAGAARAVELEAMVSSLVAEQARQADGLRALDQEASALAAGRERLAALVREARGEVVAFLAANDHADLREAVLAADGAIELVDQVLAARAGTRAAKQAAERAEAAVGEALAHHGFGSVDAVRAVLLGPEDLRRLEEQVEEHLRRTVAVQAVLTDAELFGLDDEVAPDVEPLALARDHARTVQDDAHARATAARHRHARTLALLTELDKAAGQWAPVREAYETAAQVASFAEGKHPDNRLQMRLSAYVLAHRLAQVVEAANLRLTRMSDERYTLEHTGRRGAGEQRGGLSLLVRDSWSGEARDPVTLSGGETFVVSLALALGLADVITQEAGGADLDTLFVDEGFGSLDADTLDDVLDTLDGLRDGGRVVGVVSHVPEMQTRIPTQLRVHKDRSGSRVSQADG